MENFAVLPPNSPTTNVQPPLPPQTNHPNHEMLSTDPPLNSQPNEIFSSRGENPNILQEVQANFNSISASHQRNNNSHNFPMVPFPEEEQKTEDDNDEDLEEVSFLLIKMVKSNLVFQMLFIFLFAHFLWGVSLIILLGLSWLNDTLNSGICFHRLWNQKSKRACFFQSKIQLQLFDNSILILFKVLLLIFIIYPEFPLSYGVLLLLAQIITQICYMLYVKVIKKKPILSETIEFGFRLFVLMQTMMISLNLQGVLHWQWKDVFWCFWVVFSILTGATLGFALIFLGKIYQKCFETVDNFELKGLFWLFCTTAGVTINSALAVTEISEFLDENGKNHEDMMNAFFGLVSYFVLMLCYCVFYHKDLIQFLEKIGSEDEENVDNDQLEQQRILAALESKKVEGKVEVKKLKTERNPSKYFFPSFLKKTSSTYFKAVNSSILQTVSSKLKKSKNSSKNSSKINSFDMGSGCKPRLNNSKEDKSPLSSVLQAKKQEVFHISEQAQRSKSNHTINFVASDPVQKTAQSSMSPKFKTPTATEDHADKVARKNSGSNHDQSINCCLICFENQPDAVFMECGHGGMCYTCATDIFKKTGECYLCRKVIKQVLLLDLSQKDGHFYKVKASTRMVNVNEEHNTSKDENI